jgi:lysozyme
LKGISPTEAKKLLKYDLMVSESAINNNVQVALTQNQYDALVSFVFNIGPTAFNRSQLKKYVIQKDFKRAALEFGKWNKMTTNGVKKVIPGLTNRRLAERALFEK